jgi:hypothetical protein
MATRCLRDFEGIRVDTEEWPIVVVEFPGGRVVDEGLHGMLRHLEALMLEAERDHEKIFVITDLTNMHHISPASQRTYAGEWMKRTSMLAKVASVGAALVTPSSILRGVVTAVHWIHPPPTKSIFVATRREAIHGGIEMLEEAKVPLTRRLRELREATRPKR